MSQVIAIFVLMILFIPACFSLLFARRNTFMILWNFGWYYLIAQLGVIATQNSDGKFIGLFFAIVYILRVLSAPKSRVQSGSFVFRDLTRAQGQVFKAAKPRTSPPSQDAQVTLDAEFEHR